MNIVKRLEDIANANGWTFVHSTDFGQNLFDELLSSRQTVLMIESPINNTVVLDDNGNNIGTAVKVDKLQLLRASDATNVIGNETGYSHDSGRYSELVMPIVEKDVPMLLEGLQVGGENCDCKLTRFDHKDVYGVLNFYLDGVLINFDYQCED